MVDSGTDSFRLPEDVTPLRYDLRLAPDLERGEFSGEESVSVTVQRPTTEIVLNALELEIVTVSLGRHVGENLQGSASLDEEKEQARLRFPYALEPGAWTLNITFRGKLNEKLAGFYRSTYTSDTGEERTLAVTQFEATDARRAFPCWDEPAFKAVYGLTLVLPEGLIGIANGPVIDERAGAQPGTRELQFADTISMSTYLVAFVVGEFEASEPVMAAGVSIRVWSVPGKRHLAGYALKAAAFTLDFFAEYYGIPYPGTKLDLIAIPDFAAGAMENLGAVTFRESLLLVDEASATHGELENVAVVVAHELAHMWFGDLVTMRWWNGIWLNEAFATFMEMLAVDAWKPEWETWTGFGVARAGALLIDGLQSTRPVEFTVHRPEEAEAMFDVLTYQKGGAVLRMLEQYLGADVFRRGIGRYLQQHSYANTETSDLWDALEAASGEPARRMMDSWILQPGYPIVSLEATGGSKLGLRQERFLYLRNGVGAEERWQIPLSLRVSTASGPHEQRVVLADAAASIELPEHAGWLLANAGGNGFFRVRYSRELLERLMPHVQSELSAIERFNLAGDAWAAALAGYAPLTEFLDLTALFREETDESVWSLLIGAFGSLRRMLGENQRPAIAAVVRDRLGPAEARLGWARRDDEDDRTRQMRGQILGTLGTLGDDPRIREAAAAQYATYLRNPGGVDPNIVPALLSVLASGGDADLYGEFWRRFKNGATPQEKERYLFSLAGFRDPTLLQRTLAHTLDGEIRTQDGPFLARSILSSPSGRELGWEFLKSRWEEIVGRFPESAVPRLCEGVTSLTTPELEADVQHFFATHEVKQAGKSIEQHLERLRMGVLFRQREAANLESYGRRLLSGA